MRLGFTVADGQYYSQKKLSLVYELDYSYYRWII